ncbi:MAG: hypothetical protein AB7G75_10315 [Candidatus Binatia bacterium]
MFLTSWRFLTIMLTALTTGMAFCHLLEMPARLTWNATLWVTTTVPGGLYRLFGTVGAVIDVGSWLTAVILVVLVRHRPAAFRWTLAGAGLLVTAHILWWLFVFPVNTEIATWTIESVPANWEQWRAQWEYTHAIRAILQILGVAALLWSALLETVTSSSHRVTSGSGRKEGRGVEEAEVSV